MTSAPIVGMRFHPPAPLVLASLGMEEPLLLEREPHNSHDPNAIKVCLPADWEERHPELYAEASEEALSQSWVFPAPGEPFHLGYIPREIAAEWAPIFDREGECPKAQLVFAPNGGPLAQLLIEKDEAQSDEVQPDDPADFDSLSD